MVSQMKPFRYSSLITLPTQLYFSNVVQYRTINKTPFCVISIRSYSLTPKFFAHLTSRSTWAPTT